MRDGLGSHTSLFINETLSIVNPYYVRRPMFGQVATMHGAFDAAIEDLCRLGS
jgi:hypothetical protein